MTSALLDFSLRTKAGPRIAQGLIEPLRDACAAMGWTTDVIVAPGVSDTGDSPQEIPDRTDLYLEEFWLPRLARKYDVVYTPREGMRLAGKGPPVVLQLHEHQHQRYSSWRSLRVMARGAWQQHRGAQMYDGAAGICFSSSWTRREFDRLEGREPSVGVVAHLAGWPDHKIPDGPAPKELLVVANASSDPRDDVDWAIRGWADAELPPPWRLALFGKSASPRKGSSDVEWLGRLSDADLYDLLSRASCYIHTGRLEGFGLGVVEALQLGTAVVARGGSALDELLPSSAGFLLAPDDTPSGALTALSESDLGTLAGQAWTAGNRFSWSRTANAIAATLAAVLDNKSDPV